VSVSIDALIVRAKRVVVKISLDSRLFVFATRHASTGSTDTCAHIFFVSFFALHSR
jgi:hypothetical protein